MADDQDPEAIRVIRHIIASLTHNINRGLDSKLATLIEKGERLMADLTALEAQVQATVDVEASAVVLIKGLADALAAAGTDPVKLAELEAEMKASADSLAAAVKDNTPPTP